MGPSTVPKELVSLITSPSTSYDQIVDAVEEWIISRRSKGETLFEVSVGLVELEDRAPRHVVSAIDRARYVTSTPQPSDLTPPTGPFPLSRSQSPITILHHLLSEPTPTIEHSREVILEYVLNRESKARERKPGRGGKGTLGRDSFEDISKRLGEIEDGLMRSSQNKQLSLEDLDEPRQLGMALVLSLRMSLSYFTFQELADQLLQIPISVAEKVLVQHIRRRVEGEGRWGVGKELEYIESLVITQRPTVKPAFRSAKARTLLPSVAIHQIPLPAPGKSACIKLLQHYGTAVAPTPTSPVGYFARRTPSYVGSSSPRSPAAPLPSPSTSAEAQTLATYAKELLTEYLTREKREWMLKTKWAKTGRDQLGRDLGEIEAALCLTHRNASPQASTLLPIFLLLRRTFTLPPSPLPSDFTEPYMDILPAPPDPDDVPFRPPGVQTTCASLYVNPRLSDAAAYEVLEELVLSEMEIVKQEGATEEECANWVDEVIESVQKRFPDGSYESVFERVKATAGRPAAPALVHPPTLQKQPSMHRRAVSSQAEADLPPPTLRQHSRSASLPARQSIGSSSDTSDESEGEVQAIVSERPPTLPPLNLASPVDLSNGIVSPTGSKGWWDVVSAIQPQAPTAPWTEPPGHRATGSSGSTFTLPPGAEAPQMQYPVDFSRLNMGTPPRNVDYLPEAEDRDVPNQSPLPHTLATPTPLQRMQLTPPPTAELGPEHLPNSQPFQQSNDYSPPTPPKPPITRYASGTPPRLPSSRASPMHRPQPSPPVDSDSSDDDVAPAPPPLSRPTPPPLSLDRTKFDPTSTPMSQPTTPPATTPAGTKHKFGGFGRSVSMASKSMISRNKKEKEKEEERAKRNQAANNPGKWNKDMVANIMGPPADRR